MLGAFLLYRNRVSEILRRSGYRVLSPFKVPLGWVDVAAFRRGESIGFDIYSSNYESCAERLSSHPFSATYIIGNCEMCDKPENLDFQRIKSECDGEVDRILSAASSDVSIETKAVEDALAFLYIAGEVFEDKIDDYGFKPLTISLPELKKYGFAVTHSRPKIERKDFVTLTKDGVEIAKKIILSRLILFDEKLADLLEDNLTYLLALGIASGFPISNFKLRDKSLKSILEWMNSFSINSYHFPLESAGFAVNPKFLFAHFLVSTVLNDDAVRLCKKLSKMGLAYRVRHYTPFGDEVGERYAVAREVIEVLMKNSYTHVDGELLNEFMAMVYPMQCRDVYPILGRCREYLLKAEKAGVCTISGDKIELKEDFEKYAKIRLSIVFDRFLSGV